MLPDVDKEGGGGVSKRQAAAGPPVVLVCGTFFMMHEVCSTLGVASAVLEPPDHAEAFETLNR